MNLSKPILVSLIAAFFLFSLPSSSFSKGRDPKSAPKETQKTQLKKPTEKTETKTEKKDELTSPATNGTVEKPIVVKDKSDKEESKPDNPSNDSVVEKKDKTSPDPKPKPDSDNKDKLTITSLNFNQKMNPLNDRCSIKEGIVTCSSSKEKPLSSKANQIEQKSIQIKLRNGAPLDQCLWVGSGMAHSCALKKNGSVWCWGENTHGVLGNGSENNIEFPIAVQNVDGSLFMDIISLGVGRTNNCAVKKNGTLWCWGSNSSGQIGDGSKERKPNPVMVRNENWIAFANVSQVAVGDDFACSLKKNGTVWCWGSNLFGQLGTGLFLDHRFHPSMVNEILGGAPFGKVKEILVSSHSICALKNDKSVWCWGDNHLGQLHDGTYRNQSSPVKIKLDK